MIRLRRTLGGMGYAVSSSGIWLCRDANSSAWRLERISERGEAREWEARNPEAFEQSFATLRAARSYIEACAELDPLPNLSTPVPRSALRPHPQGGYAFDDPQRHIKARITRGNRGWVILFSRRSILVPSLYAARCALGEY